MSNALLETERVTLLDLLDRLLETGVVMDGEIDLSVADINLVHLGLKLVLASSATWSSTTTAVQLTLRILLIILPAARQENVLRVQRSVRGRPSLEKPSRRPARMSNRHAQLRQSWVLGRRRGKRSPANGSHPGIDRFDGAQGCLPESAKRHCQRSILRVCLLCRGEQGGPTLTLRRSSTA